MKKAFMLVVALYVFVLFIPGSPVAQDIESPATRPQVMLGMRVIKVTLSKKHRDGLVWKEMPFKPGMNTKIDFFKVLKKLKAVGDMEVLFNQSLIGIAGGSIEADTTMTVLLGTDFKERIEVGGRFAGEIDVAGDDAQMDIEYKISYLYGQKPPRIAKTNFKSNIAIGSGQTLVLDDLIVEKGEDDKRVEVLVFISAYVIK